LFSQKDFIAASRKFVCVRLESYESKEHQDMVRSFLDGRFENTAFCLLAPDGKERLSGTGRSPLRVVRAGGPRAEQAGRNSGVIAEMNRVAKKLQAKGEVEKTVVQDFHSFRQALNVASADQRLLVFVVAPEKEREKLRTTLAPVFGDPEMDGRFHWDFADAKSDGKWAEAVSGVKDKSGVFIIHADAFGMKGEAMARLSLDAKPDELKSALSKANRAFGESEKRKVYSDHVAAGRRAGIHFEGGMPYGEDRDGDGEIDHRRGSPGGEGRGPGGSGRGPGRPGR